LKEASQEQASQGFKYLTHGVYDHNPRVNLEWPCQRVEGELKPYDWWTTDLVGTPVLKYEGPSGKKRVWVPKTCGEWPEFINGASYVAFPWFENKGEELDFARELGKSLGWHGTAEGPEWPIKHLSDAPEEHLASDMNSYADLLVRRRPLNTYVWLVATTADQRRRLLKQALEKDVPECLQTLHPQFAPGDVASESDDSDWEADARNRELEGDAKVVKRKPIKEAARTPGAQWIFKGDGTLGAGPVGGAAQKDAKPYTPARSRSRRPDLQPYTPARSHRPDLQPYTAAASDPLTDYFADRRHGTFRKSPWDHGFDHESDSSFDSVPEDHRYRARALRRGDAMEPIEEDEPKHTEDARLRAAFVAHTEVSTESAGEAEEPPADAPAEGRPWGPQDGRECRGGDKDFDFLRQGEDRASREEQDAVEFRSALRRVLQKDKRHGFWDEGRRFGFKGRTREFVEFIGEDGQDFASQRLEQYAQTTRGKWQLSEAGVKKLDKWISEYARTRTVNRDAALRRFRDARASGRQKPAAARGRALRTDKDFGPKDQLAAKAPRMKAKKHREPIVPINRPIPAGVPTHDEGGNPLAPVTPTSLVAEAEPPATASAPAEAAEVAADPLPEADFGDEPEHGSACRGSSHASTLPGNPSRRSRGRARGGKKRNKRNKKKKRKVRKPEFVPSPQAAAAVALVASVGGVAAVGPGICATTGMLTLGYIAFRCYEVLQAAGDVAVSAVLTSGAAVEAATEHIVGVAAAETASWVKWAIAAVWTGGLVLISVVAVWCCRAIQKGIGKGSCSSSDGDGPSETFQLSPQAAPLALEAECWPVASDRMHYEPPWPVAWETQLAEADPYDDMLTPDNGVLFVEADDVGAWRELQQQLTNESICNALQGTREKLARGLERKKAVKLVLGSHGITSMVRGTYPYVQHILAGSLLEAECDCPDYKKTGLLCKHGGAVLMTLHNSRILAAVERASPSSGATAMQPLAIEDVHRAPAAAAVRALREVTLERDQLRGELALAREQLAQSAGEAGLPPRILDASSGQTSRVAAIRSAKSYVYLAAFTYDLDDVTEALASARARCSKLDIKVLIDQEQAMTGNTRNLRPRIIQLHSRGVQVRLFNSQRLHAKVLLTDVGAYIGSLNWTRASLCNVERVVRLHLRGAAEKAEKDWFLDLWRRAKDFDGKTAVPTTPPK